MTIVAILFAVVLAFLAFRLIAGMVKFGVIALIVIAVGWFVLSGGAH
jgi:hypothetical protein